MPQLLFSLLNRMQGQGRAITPPSLSPQTIAVSHFPGGSNKFLILAQEALRLANR